MRDLAKQGKIKNKERLSDLNEPHLGDWYLPYWYAFFDLNAERTHNGWTLQPLKLADIKLQLELYNLYDAYGVKCIRALDEVYLEWVHETYYKDQKK